MSSRLYLTVWVFVCMLLGVALGSLSREAVRPIGEWGFASDSHVKFPIAVLI